VVLTCLGVSYASWEVSESPGVAAADDASREAIAELEARLTALRPREPYVVIDTYNNRLRVHRGDELLRDAVCSTGSGVVLLDPRGERSWTFDSPLGERRVQRKVKNPVWAKPDWAFIEEGYLPPKDPNLRFDDFSLGDYALYLGDGYIIHGTIFQTLLGRPVTHGCVRVGDEDLEYVYRTVPIGARVYLY
jgi:L,D-transpeptidase YbiS